MHLSIAVYRIALGQELKYFVPCFELLDFVPLTNPILSDETYALDASSHVFGDSVEFSFMRNINWEALAIDDTIVWQMQNLKEI